MTENAIWLFLYFVFLYSVQKFHRFLVCHNSKRFDIQQELIEKHRTLFAVSCALNKQF